MPMSSTDRHGKIIERMTKAYGWQFVLSRYPGP